MFAGLWAKLLLAGGTLLALGVIALRAMGVLKKAGVDQERSQALQQQATKVQDANQARAGLAGATDAQLDDSLRPPDARNRH